MGGTMAEFEGRGAARIESENLLSYRLFDNEGQEIDQGVVITLDISRTGIAIESINEMPAGKKIELTIGIGSDIVKAKGHVQNCKKSPSDKYQIGIEFDFLTEDDLSKIGMAYPSILK